MTLIVISVWGLAALVGSLPVYAGDNFNNFSDEHCEIGVASTDNVTRLAAILFFVIGGLFVLLLGIMVVAEARAAVKRSSVRVKEKRLKKERHKAKESESAGDPEQTQTG